MNFGQLVAAVFLATFVIVAGAAGETALMVTYGPEAPVLEGDDDFLQIVFLEVPKDTGGPLYIRLFDPDVGDQHDNLFGRADTVTRFALFGGTGAGEARSPQPGEEQIEMGSRLEEQRYGTDPGLDNRWTTFAEIDPADGEDLGDRYLFKLVVRGDAGNDANAYDVTLSTSEHRNAPPAGLVVTNYAPTFRLAGRSPAAQVEFQVPAGAEGLDITTFDAANAPVILHTATRDVPLQSSDQGLHATTRVELEALERGRAALLTLGAGGENPNDVVFSVNTAAGDPLPLSWPVTIRRTVSRVEVKPASKQLADCRSVAFETTPGDGGLVQYRWEFGDGQEGLGSHVVHRYALPGDYRARLTATSTTAVLQTILNFDVVVNRPPLAVVQGDTVVAPGQGANFDGSLSTDDDGRVERYLWDFGDGDRGKGATAEHAFRNPGRYGVILTVEDDSGSPCNFAIAQHPIQVNHPPVAEAGEGIDVSVGETFFLDGSRSYDTDGGVIDHSWELDGQGIGEGERLETRFDRPGEYTVTLNVRDDSGVGNSVGSDRVRVVVNDPPIAEAGEDLALAVGEIALFDAQGSTDPDGRIVDFSWDFGDGTEARGARVPYAFHQPGRYPVTLTVRDNSPAASGIDSDQLTVVVNAEPVAEAGPDQVVTASEVRFDGSDSHDTDGQIVEYRWDFGDGSQGESAAPRHVYSEPGTYVVTLTVTDDSGTPRNTDSDRTTVVVNERPVADAGPDRAVAPGEPIYFSGQDSLDPDGEIVGYEWLFGDGNRAIGETAVHSFDKSGTYTVRLAVRDDTGEPRAVDFDEAVVRVNAAPVAEAGPDLVAAPGQEVTLSAAGSHDSDGRIKHYRWSFSDNGPESEQVVVKRHFDTPGIYRVELEVQDDSAVRNGSDTDMLTVRVNQRPKADPGSDIVSCENAVSLDATRSVDPDGDPLAYRWDLGDGARAQGATLTHIYPEGGSYPVTLVVDDGLGLDNSRDQASMIVRINRHPMALPGQDLEGCAGEVVLFDGSGSTDPDGGLLRYRWDFGDGSGSDEVNPSKLYKQGGTYTASLSVEDDSGLACNADTQQVSVRINESPTAEVGPDRTVCANTAVRFDGSASKDFDGVVNRFRWDFGDGTRGEGIGPDHTFTEAGEYRVRLTVTGDRLLGCDNTDTDEALVRVLGAPAPRIDGPTQVPVGQTAGYDGGGSTGEGAEIIAWQWDFGDGTLADEANATHKWGKPGRYTVELTLRTASESDCNVVSREQLVIVNQAPMAVAGTDQVVGVHQLVTLDGSQSEDEDGVVVDYQWDLGDGNTASGVTARHRYRESGRYTVRLTVRDDAGLENSSASDEIVVVVNQAPVPLAQLREPPCAGVEAQFNADASSDADGQIQSYQWIFGDGQTAEGVQVAHAYERPGHYQLTLIVDDGSGVINGRQQTSLEVPVNQPPVAIAGPAERLCPGEVVRLDGSGSFDPDGSLVAARWTLVEGTDGEVAVVDALKAEPVVEAPGLYTARLEVTDDSGSHCATAVDTKPVRVNAPPVAEGGDDRQMLLGGAHDALLFDAGDSHDPDDDTLSFVWDLGDGNRKVGEKVYHSYKKTGRYPVRLIVEDGTGTSCGSSSDEFVVEARTR